MMTLVSVQKGVIKLKPPGESQVLNDRVLRALVKFSVAPDFVIK
jgi:hypothetical protein